MDADYIINYLKLTEHPEGGWFKETFQSKETSNGKRSMVFSELCGGAGFFF